MRIKLPTVATIACGGMLLVGCARESAAPAPQATAPGATAAPVAPPAVPNANPAAATQPPPQAKPEPKPAGQAPAATPLSPARPASAPPSPAPLAATPPSPPSPPAPVVSAPAVVDPGGPIAVAATKPGLTRVGARKCGVCHRPQLASWAESAHGKRTPPLDCENCHGPGSEYNPLAVMKNPEKAKAAGLVRPAATFCATCHKRGWHDGQLQKVHAHKAPPGS